MQWGQEGEDAYAKRHVRVRLSTHQPYLIHHWLGLLLHGLGLLLHGLGLLHCLQEGGMGNKC
jgi:hypothetical protein